jgi:outer membrane protein assembly factor BamA
VTIEVDPGPATRVEEVVLEAFPENLTRRARRVLSLQSDDVFSEQSLVESQAELVVVLRNGGYARAAVEPAIEEIAPNRVRVRFVVDSKQLYVFGEIYVEGVAEDLVPLATRTINLRPGQRYSSQSLNRAHENLRLLNLFRQIRLTTEEAAPGTLDVPGARTGSGGGFPGSIGIPSEAAGESATSSPHPSFSSRPRRACGGPH